MFGRLLCWLGRHQMRPLWKLYEKNFLGDTWLRTTLFCKRWPCRHKEYRWSPVDPPPEKN